MTILVAASRGAAAVMVGLALAAAAASDAQAERVRERHFEPPLILPGTDRRADEPRQVMPPPSRPPERRDGSSTPTPRERR